MSERPVRAGLLGAVALLLTLAGVLLWLLMLSGPVRLASGMLGARTHLNAASRALSSGAFKKATLETLSAQAAARRAEAGLEAESPLLDLARTWETPRRALEEVPHLVAAASHSAEAAAGTLDVGLNALRGPDRVIARDPSGEGSVVVLERVAELGERVVQIRDELSAAREELEAVSTENLPKQMRDDVADGIERAEETDALLDRAEAGLLLLPRILGADEPRTYMLGFMNSAELRGTGGAMLQFACLTIDRGKPILPTKSKDGEPSDVQERAPDCRGSIYQIDVNRQLIDIPLPEDAWYVAEIEDAQRFGNSNWSPDWPLSARLALDYGNASQEDFPDIDGVIAVDPLAVKKLMPGVGPFTIQAGNRISRSKVINFLLAKAYSSFPIPAYRRTVLGQVVDGFYQRMFDPLHPTDLVQGFGDALGGKHVQIWMADPAEQRFVERMDWDAAIRPASGSDYLYVVQQNVGGNKLDYTATQSTKMDVSFEGPDALVAMKVTIHNGIDLPQPRWVLGDSKSAHRPMINVYVPLDSELAAADAGQLCTPAALLCNGRLDVPAPASWGGGTVPPSHTEKGKRVWTATLQIPVDEKGSFALDYRVPGVVQTSGKRKVYRLVVQRQPKVNPEQLVVRLRLPEGAGHIKAPGFVKRGGALVYDRTLTTDRVLEVSWQS